MQHDISFDEWLDDNLASQGLTREVTDPELLQRMADLLRSRERERPGSAHAMS